MGWLRDLVGRKMGDQKTDLVVICVGLNEIKLCHAWIQQV